MAKKRNRIATGLSIKDILSMKMDKYENLSFREQKEITSRLASAANKRYKIFNDKEIVNPAVLDMTMSGGKISVRNKSESDVKEEFFRAKKFLKSVFSTQKGYKEYLKKLDDALKLPGKGIYKGMDYSLKYATAFAYYDTVQELSPNIQNIKEKYKITDKIAEYMDAGLNEEEIFDNLYKYLKKEYEIQVEQFNDLSVIFGNKLEDETPDRFKRKGL